MSERRHLLRWGLTIVAIAVWAFVGLALWTFDPTDWPSHAVYPHAPTTQNRGGFVGAFVAYHAFASVGGGAWAVLFFTGLFLGMKLWGQTLGDVWLRAVGLILTAVALAGLIHLLIPNNPAGLPEGTGGILGISAGGYLRAHFSAVGSGLVLVVALILGVILTADELVIRVPWMVTGAYRRARDLAPAVSFSFPPAPKLETPRFVTKEALASAVGAKPTKKPRPAPPVVEDEEVEEELPPAPPLPRLPGKTASLNKRAKALKAEAEKLAEAEMVDVEDVVEVAPAPSVDEEEDDVVAEDRDDASDDGIDGEPDEVSEPVVEATPEPVAAPAEPKRDIVVRLPSMQKPKRTAPPPPKELGDYTLPAWDALGDAEYGYVESQEAFVREKAAVLEQALREFGVDASVAEIDTGPVITMYEIALGTGIRVSAITALSNDIARALSATSVRIVAPIPGKNTVGIEVPNLEKEKVRLKELMQLAPDSTQKMAIPVYLGKDASGQPVIEDLTRMPHGLIAGTTGSGKSVCINTIILSIMYTQRPDTVKLILVDPKVVEMAPFKDIPHLMCPVITETSKATAVLEWACDKMDERYAVLAEAGVRNLAGYNKLTREELVERFNPQTPEEEAKIPKKLPYIVIIIDELADLMMTSGKEVESHIVRIAQKARAVGIHLILATQRPQATVVTGLIKANMPCKVAFRVASRMDSRIVLDQNGAELLLGQGDMLFMPPGASKPTRGQGTFIDDKEIRESVKVCKSLAEQQFEPELVQIKGAGLAGDDEERDELFDQAVRVVLETKRGSVSLLQRRLTIGYGRASRIIEQMAAAGILGDHKGSQAREPMITIEDWEAIQAQQTKDEEEGMTV